MILRSNLVRAVGLVALALLLAYALPAPAQTQPAVLRAAVVAPGVWALVGPLGGPSLDNQALNASYGVVATPAGTILIDSGASAQGAQLLAGMARQLTGQPVRWVIDTGSQHLGTAPPFAQLANFVPLHRANINRAYLRAEVGD